MIEIRNLKKEYETVTPLKDVTVTINDGDVISIIGPSGTGKSTFIRCINMLEKPSSGRIIVDGEEGCAVKFARCCNPLPGDPVVGFITKGYGISVHKHNCRNIALGMKDPAFRDRLVNVRWDTAAMSDSSRDLYEAVIKVYAENHISLLADVTAALAEMRVTLVSVNTKKRVEDEMIIQLTVGCRNSEHFDSIVSKLRSVPHVKHITRGSG